MGTVKFTARLEKFGKMGEKSAWTYIQVPAKLATKLKPDCKVSFRVKGSFDDYTFEKVAMLPMGEGNFIIPLKAPVRKQLGKQEGNTIKVVLDLDERAVVLSPDLMRCLKDDPKCLAVFKAMPGSHQKYYSNWIESAKTIQTKTKRILMTMEAMAKKQDFGAMIRESQGKK
jgi:hypothetical protein